MTRIRTQIVATWAGLVLAALLPLTPAVHAQSADTTAATESASAAVVALRIAPETVARFAELPIQEGGRVKPIDTYARVLLIRFYGSRTLRLPGEGGEDHRISAAEWLLTCLLYPEWAVHYPTFRLDNQDVAVTIGLQPHASRRERYSYAELFPVRTRLITQARQFSDVDRKRLTPAQTQLLALAGNLVEYESLVQHMAFARERLPVSAALFPSVGGTNESLSVSEYLAILPRVRADVGAGGEPGVSEPRLKAMSEQLSVLQHYMEAASLLHLVPTPDAAAAEWASAGRLIQESFMASSPDARAHGVTSLARLEALVAARDAAPALHAAVDALVAAHTQVAASRGEGTRLGLELTLHRANLFSWSLVAFLFSFVGMAFTWLWPAPVGRLARAAVTTARAVASGALAAGTLALIAGIVMRCIIRGRPPVSTLYETLLFITAVVVVVSVAVEWINRQRVALALAPVLGALGMFLANKYELKEAADTMPSLQAVLDTNFWLATHVTCITIGYAAGLLAGAIGHLYILGRVFRVREGDALAYAGIGRMVYGVLCFGLFFSFLGTMLGGIWANYSWGRFWGWDPKENGALMIVLWQLIMLHARMGGYVRDFGVSVLAILGGCIVAFSWWGVNLLGVGLHSYGFTHGIWGALLLFWGVEVAVITMGLLWRGGQRFVRAETPPATGPA